VFIRFEDFIEDGVLRAGVVPDETMLCQYLQCRLGGCYLHAESDNEQD